VERLRGSFSLADAGQATSNSRSLMLVLGPVMQFGNRQLAAMHLTRWGEACHREVLGNCALWCDMNLPGKAFEVEAVPVCMLCNGPARPVYDGLVDRLFGAPGTWSVSTCSDCGLAWLNPRPRAHSLAKAYEQYHTHHTDGNDTFLNRLREKTRLALYSTLDGYEGLAAGWGWRRLGSLLAVVPFVREIARVGTMELSSVGRGKLLDVGCGAGRFLDLMRKADWEVFGVEPDARAARTAESLLGVPITVGSVSDARFPDDYFDAVTLNHVLEHVYDPLDLIRECLRVLRPEGRLVIVTPNLESLGHTHFRSIWRGLEPPRHLYLFSMRALRSCSDKAGLRILSLYTTPRLAWRIFLESQAGRGARWASLARALLFQIREGALLRRHPEVGEEIVLRGTKASTQWQSRVV